MDEDDNERERRVRLRREERERKQREFEMLEQGMRPPPHFKIGFRPVCVSTIA